MIKKRRKRVVSLSDAMKTRAGTVTGNREISRDHWSSTELVCAREILVCARFPISSPFFFFFFTYTTLAHLCDWIVGFNNIAYASITRMPANRIHSIPFFSLLNFIIHLNCEPTLLEITSSFMLVSHSLIIYAYIFSRISLQSISGSDRL